MLGAAKQIVDASGSAVAARMLGSEIHAPSEPQPMSWLFTMAGVEPRTVRDFQLARPEQFVLHPAFDLLREDYVAVSGFFEIVAEGKAAGEFSIPRDRLLFFSTPRPGEVLVNTTRIPANHPVPHQEGLRQISELATFLINRVPGFARARLGRIADDIGERESFRLQGRQTLSVEDIVEFSSARGWPARKFSRRCFARE